MKTSLNALCKYFVRFSGWLTWGNSRTYPDEDQGEEMRKGYDPSKVDADEDAVGDVGEVEQVETQPSTSGYDPSTQEEQNAWRRSP